MSPFKEFVHYAKRYNGLDAEANAHGAQLKQDTLQSDQSNKGNRTGNRKNK